MLNKLSSDFSLISCYVYGNLCSPKSEVRKPKMKNRKPKSEPLNFRIKTEPNRKITEPKKITEKPKTERFGYPKTERLGFRFGFDQ